MMLSWARATRLPTVMVRAASTTRIICQSSMAGRKAWENSRSIRAKAAAFDPTARYAVIGVGAPS